MDHVHAVSLKLPAPMLAALSAVARDQDVTPGQFIRDAIARDLRRRRAKAPVGVDATRVAPAFRRSKTWADLHQALHAQGYRVTEDVGDLALYAAGDDRRICRVSDLGFSLATLGRRLGTYQTAPNKKPQP